MYSIPVGFHFKVEFGFGEPIGDNLFQEVSGLSSQINTEEVKEGGINTYTHKIPSGVKYGNLTLKRGMFVDSKVFEWCQAAIENFDFSPVDVNVTLLNALHLPLAAWSFTKAYPVKWSISAFKAQGNELVIESLELAYAYFRRVPVDFPVPI